MIELALSWTVHCFWTMGCLEHCGIVGEILGGVKSKSSGLRDGLLFAPAHAAQALTTRLPAECMSEAIGEV